MDFFFLAKLLIVIFFLVMFMRGPKVVWGVGLLTVSSAFLLDTALGTFGRQELQERMGFFFYVISGALFGGGAVWLWALLRTSLERELDGTIIPVNALRRGHEQANPLNRANSDFVDAEKRRLFAEIHSRLGPDDVRDLVFDLELNENDLIAPQQEMSKTIYAIVDLAEQEGKMEALSLAVERILTPVTPESLPRPEKLTAHSPPTILRHYLLAHFSQRDLVRVMEDLDIDWEQLSQHDKRETVRDLLLYLQRRDRLDQLVPILRAHRPFREEE